MSDIVRLPSTTNPTCWTATGFTIEKVLAAASRKTSPAQQRQVPIHKQPFCYQGKRLRLEENCAVMSKTPASHRSKTSPKFCFPPRMPSFNRHSCQSFQTCTDCRAYGRLVQQAEVHVERDGSKPDKTIAHKLPHGKRQSLCAETWANTARSLRSAARSQPDTVSGGTLSRHASKTDWHFAHRLQV